MSSLLREQLQRHKLRLDIEKKRAAKASPADSSSASQFSASSSVTSKLPKSKPKSSKQQQRKSAKRAKVSHPSRALPAPPIAAITKARTPADYTAVNLRLLTRSTPKTEKLRAKLSAVNSKLNANGKWPRSARRHGDDVGNHDGDGEGDEDRDDFDDADL